MSDSVPAELTAIARLMAAFDRPWAFCGGWAVHLFLGDRCSRQHKDVDIAVLRRDQLAVQSYLRERGWTLEVAHGGVLTPWAEGEYLELPRHGIWCRNPAHEPDFLEVLLNEGDDAVFRFRTDPSIALPLERAFLRSPSDLPFIAPEIALLYKAGNVAVEENAADFQTALPALDAGRRAWLRDALARRQPGHPWLSALGEA